MIMYMYFVRALQALVDIVLPPSRDAQRVRTLTAEHLHTLLAPTRSAHTDTLFRYAEPDIRILIWQAKYHDNKDAAELLGVMVRDVMFHTLKKPHLIIPIPLSHARFRERGFNQASRIAHAATRNIPHLVLKEDVLARTGTRPPQAKLEKEARLHNLDNVFLVTDASALLQKDVILLDDVMTTGTTLKQARRALLKAGAATVHCIALAH